jgi:hypothetical protein
MWKCRKCGDERARRQGTECEKGGEHDWADRDEVNEELKQKAERRRLEAEGRRLEAKFKYQSCLNSAAGQGQLAEIINGYMARRRKASLWSLILGLIAIPASLITVIVYFGNALDVLGISNLSWFKLWIFFSFSALLRLRKPPPMAVVMC